MATAGLTAVAQLPIAPLVVALVTAVVTLAVRRSRWLVAAASLAGGFAYLAVVGLLFLRVTATGTAVYQLSAWPAPFGIVLVADALAVFMLVLAAVVSLGALVSSVRSVDPYGQRLTYHALFHLMLVGVSGAFLTGDIFNLFVWFEVMLMASYVLVVFYSGPEHTRAALTYVVLNLAGSAVMLVAIGGLYATTGTLNMADLARRLAEPAAYGVSPVPVLGLSALLFAVFALKAGIVPFHFWVPAAYAAAPAPVAAVLAGVVKKVGVYAVIRLYFTVFAAASMPVALPGIAGTSALAFFGPVLFVAAVASIAFGGLAAVGRDDFDGVLAYSSVSQVGFIVLPLAVGATVPAVRQVAIAAALVYTLNHGVAKAMLFLASGAVRAGVGSGRLTELGGLAGRSPGFSIAVFVGLLSLVGVPPVLGFFGKLYVFDVVARAAVAAPAAGVVLAGAAALGGAVLTIAYLSRLWNRVFWGPATGRVATGGVPRVDVLVVAAFAIALVALGVGFEPVARAADAAAEAALDRPAYVEAVLGGMRP